MSSNNPFDSTRSSIWAARTVEWPIPSALSTAHYNRLLQMSRQIARQLGMTIDSGNTVVVDVHGVDSSAETATAVSSVGAATMSSAGSGGGNYSGGISGFMSRVLNVSQNAELSDGSLHLRHRTMDVDAASCRPLRPPRTGCVAAANGWIVTCLECPVVSGSSNNNKTPPPLRLVNRWNVRRGGAGGTMAEQWIALPPPVRMTPCKIMHVLVDPTASHTLVSASNGECYYIHSSSKLPIKLHGFGLNVDGNPPKEITGIAATTVAHREEEHTQTNLIQRGVTLGSFVTAVAWDKERGTEGSTKTILLGTSMGEIYEYAMSSPNSEDKEDMLHMPVLLHKLYNPDTADPSEIGASVTGIHFERLRTGLLVLAATSGRHKRTRFYSFYSPHSSSFRMVMADQQYASLTELPGSLDFADLRLCGDHFGLLSASGIYFGTIDRTLSSVSQSSSGSVKMIMDAGILPYGNSNENGMSNAPVPVSLAVTPHHLITLSETNDVLFLNRVAQKIIQKERLDSILQSVTSTSSLDESQLGVGELMMDIRRPDQVWLRKGRCLVHISSSQEDRDVWKFTLQKCLEFSTKNHSGAGSSDISPGRQARVLERRSALLGSPTEQLSEEEKALETMFEQAKTLCTNSAQKAVVTAIRAEYHLCQGRTELAAKYFAQCPASLEPFADTAIRLGLSKLGVDDPRSYSCSSKARLSLETSNLPLIAYLSDKMRVSSMNADKMTSTMIGAWLTELYLNERGDRVTASLFSTDESKSAKEADASQRAFLARFLNANVSHMDSSTIIKILASHDVGALECSAFASKSGDIATAVNAALCMSSDIAHGVYEALQILDDAPFELAESLYYKHAPIFLARAPGLASDSFTRRYIQGLSPLKLLPALIKYEEIRVERARHKETVDSTQSMELQSVEEKGVKKSVVDVQSTGTLDGFELHVHEEIAHVASFENDSTAVTKYLESVIRLGCRSTSVYSYLISLYTKLEDEEPLYNFLFANIHMSTSANDAAKKTVQVGTQQRSQYELSSPLDMPFALRTVLKSGRHFRSAILLYKGFGMRQEAVELALKVDPSVARELAQESIELEERKRLWLMIAKNAASDPSNRAGKDVVSRVVVVLRECGPDVLSIEDVLPYMPDFASINQIKEEICEALTSYSSKIDVFLKEMSDCDQVCDCLREEIRRLRSYRMRMKPDARCSFTNKLVIDAREPFYIFPSGYVVLASVLKKEMLPYLNEQLHHRVTQLEAILTTHVEDAESLNKDESKSELDGLIAAECPMTGTVMIESVDRMFDDCNEVWES